MIKTTGKEYKAFYSDPSVWGQGDYYYEDAVFTRNGNPVDEDDEDPARWEDTDRITLMGGCLHYQGHGGKRDPLKNDNKSMESVFRAWRKRQKTASLQVTLPPEKEALCVELLVRAGCKIIGPLQVEVDKTVEEALRARIAELNAKVQ